MKKEQERLEEFDLGNLVLYVHGSGLWAIEIDDFIVLQGASGNPQRAKKDAIRKFSGLLNIFLSDS